MPGDFYIKTRLFMRLQMDFQRTILYLYSTTLARGHLSGTYTYNTVTPFTASDQIVCCLMQELKN